MKNKILTNASWIIICKVLQSIITLIIGMLTARYLGPSNYGVLNYVISIVTFALPIMQLGLNQTLVKELILNLNNEGAILGTSIAFNLISSIFCILGCNLFVFSINTSDSTTIKVCILYSIVLVFQATEMLQYWFQAKLLSKYTSIAALCAYFAVAIYKIILLILEKNIIWFAFSNVLDHLLVSLVLIFSYRKVGGERLSIDLKLGKEMISRSVYYILPSLMLKVFQHTDKIMLNIMMNEKETGIYSAAITCIGISAFVFSAVIDTARPVILEAKEKNHNEYRRRVIQLFCLVTYLSLFQSIGTTILAKPLVLLLYGEAYCETIGILRIAVWYITFSYFGSVRNIWILAENLQKHLLKINFLGAILNIILNYIMIPVIGPLGAACASIISQIFTNVILSYAVRDIRPVTVMMFESLNPLILIRLLKNMYIQFIKKYR